MYSQKANTHSTFQKLIIQFVLIKSVSIHDDYVSLS